MSSSVSCVIPTHNRTGFLELALRSIAAQDTPPLEVIVASDVDDPRAEALCAELDKELPFPVRYVHEAGSATGASASRNMGARLAQGELLAFLDDDDLWEPQYLRLAEEAISQSGRDIAVTWRQMVKGSTRVDAPVLEEGLRARDVIAVSLGTTGSNIVVTAAAFRAIGGFDEGIPVKNDTDFFYRLLFAGFDYAVVAERLVLQVKHGSGQLTGNTEHRAAGTEIYMRKHRDQLRLKDRRHLRLSIHRIRYHTATTATRRIGHLALALLNYSPVKYVQERRLRQMWLALDQASGD